jgi:hypothetical protein
MADALSPAVRDTLAQLQAATLHRLLGWGPDSASRFRHDRANRLPYDLVVVDETSMVSLTLMARLLEALRPDARLVLVGYPDPVPQPPGCYPAVPIAPGDLSYLHRVAENLSATVEDAAQDGGAEYVHLLTGSIGHDICQPPGTKWYEGVVPTSPAYPAHPNELGMEFAARQLLDVLGR